MSMYVATWPVEPGVDLEHLIPQALEQLPLMLATDGAELLGRPTWSLSHNALAMAAEAGPYRGERPWESREAWIADMMPDPWREPLRIETGTGWPADVDRTVQNSREVA